MQGTKSKAFLYATIVALGGFIFGLDAAVISGTIGYITQEFGLTALQQGSVVGSAALGVLVALPFAGYACNAFGRKRTLQIIAALYVFSALCSALAPSFVTLVAARFIGGLAFSSISVSSMYIGEIAPPHMRGKLVSMTQINIVVGLSAAYFVNYLIQSLAGSGADWVSAIGLDVHTWRWMLGTEVLPALLWLGMLSIIPLSPAWLIYRGRKEEASQTLAKLLPAADVPEAVREMEASLGSDGAEQPAMEQLKEIFSPAMRTILIIGVTMGIVQQATGINAILFYAPTVFEQLGIGTDAAFMQAIWVGLTGIFFTVLAILLVDRLGRRPIILGGLLWIALSLALCAYGFSSARYNITDQAITEMAEVPGVEKLRGLVGQEFTSDIAFKDAVSDLLGVKVARENSSILLEKSGTLPAILILIGILSFIAAFHFSVGPLMWVLFSEIFPISIRGIAIPFFTLITSITSYFVQQFFPWQLETMGGTAIFLFYASMVTIGMIILWFYLVETKNMTIEEIQALLIRLEKKVEEST
ncbi:MFS transporter [Neolewinella persica]|uniref:MFS transporter n=1 Tax=Neolewinella persica TaxID=70998 RepID=UPI00035C690E|nr:MFS transporter [Neolewinella persica]